ncbi:MAG: 50S ribosomal protein L16 [Candidatus Aureabacteria bacterium]|nr:50S ribosomal protein L16 [Candidatus Auribacterota bacterium]
MPLMPKRVKYRKTQRGSMKGNASKGNKVSFGEFGLQALERAWITNTQIEASRVAVTRHVKRGGKVFIRIFPHKSYTKKPPETRQGKGKGAVEGWVAVVRPGTMLFEMEGIPEKVAREAFRLAAYKLPIRCRFVKRDII